MFLFYPDVVESILCHGADLDIVDNDGCTSLQSALSQSTDSPNRMAVLQLMVTCLETRLEVGFR